MKSYTDISQSKKLAEILPLESADMEYLLEHWIDEKTGRHKEEYYEIPVVKVDDDCPLQPITHPCWNLAALFNLCPTINGKQPILTRGKLTRLWYCYYEDEIDTQTYDNPVDAVFEMIQLLHEQKLL